MEVAAQRPATGLDRPTSLKLARALRSSCDDHHKRALFTADGALADEAVGKLVTIKVEHEEADCRVVRASWGFT
jgi:hypothetical protein